MGTNRKGIKHKVFIQHFAECPYCHKKFKSLGLASHRAACRKKLETPKP